MLYVLNFLCFFSEHNWLLKVFVRGTKIRRSSRTARFENRQVDVFYSLHTPFSSVFYAQKKKGHRNWYAKSDNDVVSRPYFQCIWTFYAQSHSIQPGR